VGDLLLISFASRLEREIPTGATASRLGGDEFAVVITGLRSSLDAKNVVTRLHDRLGHVHDIDGFPLSVKVSIGVAVGPEPGMTAESIMATADIAMYRAKRNESGVEIESDDSIPSDHGRVGLLPDLTHAIQNSELTANYQPLVSVQTGEIIGVEALVRWNHPIHGNIPPSEFIGLAEQTDLIDPLTYEMFRLSMRDLQSLGPLMPNLAVNVSPRSLLNRRFAHDVVDIIAELGFPADRLEIEITERAIVTASERTGLALAHLHAAGVSVSVDDFGTGYSSFRILRQVRADRLKIDREFTSLLGENAADELIVTKMIELGHGLGLEVVAEGVESPAVWHRLRALGCDVAQGYCIARPMPLDELRTWLENRTCALSTPGRALSGMSVS
jgi:predicted signal transduction protein with EAL and GGDEF domain